MSTATAPAPAAAAAAEPAKKKKPMMLLVIVAVVLGAGAYWFILRPSGAEAASAEPVVESGPVVDLEPLTLNLADGRYLKIGLSLEVTEEAAHASEEGVNGAKARDAAISILGQRTYEQMLAPKSRTAAISALEKEVEKRYDGDVLDFRWTESGGPEMPAAPARPRFCSSLVGLCVETQLEGELTVRWPSSGMQLSARIPIQVIAR